MSTYYCMNNPPHALICTPFNQLALGKHNIRTAYDISSVSPTLGPTGVLSMTGCIIFMNSSPAAPNPSVLVGPGLTAFTFGEDIGISKGFIDTWRTTDVSSIRIRKRRFTKKINLQYSHT
jgi:hypothetical protein